MDNSLSIAETYELEGRKLIINSEIQKLKNELRNINDKLGKSAGRTKPADRIKHFVEDCELHKLCTQKADTETEKEVIEKFILSKRKSSESKTKNILRDYNKWKQRLARFRKEFLSD